MRLLTGFMLLLTLGTLAGCDSYQKPRESKSAATVDSPKTDADRAAKTPPSDSNHVRMVQPMLVEPRGGGGGSSRPHREASDEASAVSLASASKVYAATEEIDRKIIRNAELSLETESPTEGLRKITAAAESHGGFVVTSEFKQNPVAAGVTPTQTVTVIARVPASSFASALEQMRSAGERVISEKVSGQDVSEEYLDLEARLRTKKALETQFLEIMKQARKVQDALDVQSELADVRTEIERLEGRRRFLENQAALSTITTTLQMPQPIIAATTTGFGTTIKRTFGDAVDTAASIVLFVIQAVIVLVPIAVFFGLPGWLVWRVLRRRIVLRKPEPSPIPTK